jgi:hypothetical protein
MQSLLVFNSSSVLGCSAKKGHDLAAKTDIRIQGQAVGHLSGADAKKETTVFGQQFISLAQQIAGVAIHFQGWIAAQVVLQVAVAAIHGAVAGEVDDKVVAANLAVATGAFLQKLAPVRSNDQAFFGCAKKVSALLRTPDGWRSVVNNSERYLRQRLAQPPNDGRFEGGPLNYDFFGIERVHRLSAV